MPNFRTILVAADFSQGAQDSFHMAVSLARESKTRLFVLYVAEPMYVAPAPDYFGPQTARFSIVERDPGYYEALRERLREVYTPDHPIETEYDTRVGSAAEEILNAAEELGADLIVVGTHGRTGLRRFLTGSVAESILRRAKCPVLALRAPDPRSKSKSKLGEIRVILHPTDFSEHSLQAARVARTLARDQGARLILLHVASNEITAEGMAVMPMDPRVYRERLDEMRSGLDGPDLKFPVEAKLLEGMATTALILHAAEELHGDLIVMGTHGRSGLGRLLMGSVAEGVLRHATCPVLTIRAALPSATPVAEKPVPTAVGH